MKESLNPNVCPSCGSTDIDDYGDIVWVDDAVLEQDCSCLTCDCDFTVRYNAVPIAIKVQRKQQ